MKITILVAVLLNAILSSANYSVASELISSDVFIQEYDKNHDNEFSSQELDRIIDLYSNEISLAHKKFLNTPYSQSPNSSYFLVWYFLTEQNPSARQGDSDNYPFLYSYLGVHTNCLVDNDLVDPCYAGTYTKFGVESLINLLGLTQIRTNWTPSHSQVFKPCGLSGSITSRIRKCERYEYETPESLKGWKLVARPQKGHEVWLQLSTNLIWSASTSEMPFDKAKLFCENANKDNSETAGIALKFRLPTLSEGKLALQDGFGQTIHPSWPLYWSTDRFFPSQPHLQNRKFFYAFSPLKLETDSAEVYEWGTIWGFHEDKNSLPARCVAEL
jgi:hypothetical protein